jgi:PAS domain S-box-containing protein
MTSASPFRRSAEQHILGGIGMALLTFVCFRLEFHVAEAAFVYLILITVLSRWGNFAGSVILSMAAVGCLTYFFAPPLFSFRMESLRDAAVVTAFFLTGLIVTHLVRSARERTEAALQAEGALRASEQQWRAVFENNPTMYFMVDTAGIVLAVNPFGAAQLGYTIDEMVGRNVGKVFVEADRKAAEREIARCLNQFGQSIGWELRKQRKDGSVIWVRETARAVLRGNDPVVLIACQDITEQKQAEEKLRQAQANLARVNRVMILGEMTASIAHEVNQPLTGVVAHAGSGLRWLAAEPPNLEEARQTLEFILRDANRAEKVIDRIRALVKQVPPRRDRVDIREVIVETIALTRAELEKNGVELRTHLSGELPIVPADRVQLQQVILNLIVNAIDAMSAVDDRRRELVLKSGRSGANHVFVEVRDSGRGVDPANVARLFDSFYTNKPGGIGMGLSICRSIVEAHGGELWTTAHKPHGAVFRFTLPLKEGRSADDRG